MIYVRIPRVNGRRDFITLSEWAERSGTTSVYYSEGGWVDDNVFTVESHLKFKEEADAIAFVLAHGGEISKTPPIRTEGT